MFKRNLKNKWLREQKLRLPILSHWKNVSKVIQGEEIEMKPFKWRYSVSLFNVQVATGIKAFSFIQTASISSVVSHLMSIYWIHV